MIANSYLGEDVELNCSALANKNDVIYWSFWKENESYTNVHEEKEKTTWYAYVMYNKYHIYDIKITSSV
jgi:hypothetical protein